MKILYYSVIYTYMYMSYKRFIDSAASYFVLRLFFGISTNCLQIISELYSIIFQKFHLLNNSWLALLETVMF